MIIYYSGRTTPRETEAAESLGMVNIMLSWGVILSYGDQRESKEYHMAKE